MSTEDRAEAALFVWNPLTEPETIRVHVEHHRTRAKHPEGRFTWWGRIAVSPNPSRQYTLDPVAKAHALLVGKEPAERLVLVTDHRQLHALRVDQSVLPGPGEPAEPPKYYRGKRCELWLRVRDIRVISHDPIMTLWYLREVVKADEDGRWGVDPYASREQLNPRVVWAPPLADLFDSGLAGPTGFFADRADTIDRPVIQEAHDRLEQRFGDATWTALDDYSRSMLANAAALYDDATFSPRLRDDVDGSAIVIDIANVIERELVKGCLVPLLDEGKMAGAGTGHPLAPLVDFVDPKRGLPTLGTLASVLRDRSLRDWARQPHGRNTFATIASDEAWLSWVSRLADQRNSAAHGRGVSRRNVCRLAEHVLLPSSASSSPTAIIETIARAKTELAARAISSDT